MTLEDLLCDACLYKVEASDGGLPIADMCKRCQKKMLTELLAAAEDFSRTDTDEVD